jgi:ribonuclease R
MAEYMLDHIGKEYTGIISSVMKFGLFVELDNLVEGLIHITDIKDDYYLYDETTLSLVGKRTNKRYRIGDIINIKVKSASKEAKSIDFELA